jgi:hypothetical protein
MKGKKIKVDLQVKGTDLAGRDKEGLSDPYYIIYVPEKSKSEETGNLPETISHQKSHCLFPFVLPSSAALYGINHATVTTTNPKGFKVAYKSEKVKKNLNPEWKPVKQNLKDICYGDLTTPIIIQCWHSAIIHDVLIGGSIITMENLFSAEVADLQLMDTEHKPSGILQIKANLVGKEGEKTPPPERLDAKIPEQNIPDKSPRKSPRSRSFLMNATPKTASNPTIRLGSRDRKSVAVIPALEEPVQFLPGSTPVESSPVSFMVTDDTETIQYLPGHSSHSISSDSKPTEKESESTSGATETITVTQTEPEYTYLPPTDLL